MLTTEIQQDTHTGPVTLNPRWLRVPSAVKYSGLSRSRLYELLAQGRIVVSTNADGSVAAPERPLPLLGFQRLSTPFNAIQHPRY